MIKQFILILAIFAITITSALPIAEGQVSAASFNQNLIMDDSTFSDVNSMDEAQIDAFLNSFPNSCISSNSTFRAIEPTGYNPDSGFIYGGNVTAGRVIYAASQAYGINPQVLLTTLQKEQSLVTGSEGCNGPNKYAKAMGYGCPDNYNSFSYTGLNLYTKNGVTYRDVSNFCVNSAEKAGFTQQVIRAAWMLRYSQQRSLGNIGWAVIKGSWDNSDDLNASYSGNMTQGCFKRSKYEASCTYYDGYTTIDGTAVHLDSGATAALYRYTPHFAGNRSFVNIFVDLFQFGPTFDRNPLIRTNGTGRFYIRGANNTLYYITSAPHLADIGYGINWRISSFFSVSDSYLQGYDTSQALSGAVRFGNVPEVYYYGLGGLHYMNYETYQAYGSPPVSQLDAYVKNYFWIGDAASIVARDLTDGTLYRVGSGNKNRIANNAALDYYGLNSTPRTDTGSTILGMVSEGIPLAAPGTLITASDNSASGVVDSSGNKQHPLSSQLRDSITLPAVKMPASVLSKLPPVDATRLSILSKNSAGDLYVLDGDQKINLTASQLSNLGYTASDFTLAPPEFLNLFTLKITNSDRLLVRINGGQPVYALIDKKVVWFETAADFNSFGYQFSDVVNISKNSYDVLLSNVGAQMLPTGLLIRASNSESVFLVTAFNTRTLIPTAYLFGHLGFSFNNVRVIHPDAMASFATTASVAPFAVDASNSVWLMYGGRKYLVPQSLESNYGLTRQSTQILPWQINNLPTHTSATKFVRINSGQNVYLVEGGNTHLLSPGAYAQNGGSNFTDVTSITQDLFNWIPAGAPRL